MHKKTRKRKTKQNHKKKIIRPELSNHVEHWDTPHKAPEEEAQKERLRNTSLSHNRLDDKIWILKNKNIAFHPNTLHYQKEWRDHQK